MNEETYKAKVFCLNCDFEDTLDIEKGLRIEDKECPKCGNKTLNKKFEAGRIIPRQEDYR